MRIKKGLEITLIFIGVILTIMTCCAVGNFVSKATFIVAAVLLFGFNAVAIRKAVKKINDSFE